MKLVFNESTVLFQRKSTSTKEFDCTIPCICATLHPKRSIMYQIETVPVPILDENEQVHSYTELKIEKLYIVLNEEIIYNVMYARTENV